MPAKSPLDVRHPLFLPLWRRVVLVAFCLGWALMELVLGNPLWAILSGAAGAWCGYQFFVVFDPAEYQPPDDPDSR